MRFSILTSAVAVLSWVGCAQPEAEPGPTGKGIVRMKQTSGTLFVAGCFADGPVVPSQQCKTTTVQGCLVTECAYTPSQPVPTGATNVSPTLAGALHVVGTLADGSVGTASGLLDDASTRLPSDETSFEWAGGSELTVTATGARVPPFEQKITLPKAITVLAPIVCRGFGCPSLPANTPLRVEWSGDAEGMVVAYLGGSHTDNGVSYSRSAQCTLPRSPGSIPVEVLQQIEAAGGQNGWTFGLGAINQKHFIAGDFDILLEAATDGVGGSYFKRPGAD